MNPTSNPEHNAMNLPAPSPEVTPLPAANNDPTQAPETYTSMPEQGSSAAQPSQPTLPTMPLPLMPLPQAGTQINDDSATTASVASNTTDSSDLIDKEWVEKAKQIILQNREDPFTQSKQLNSFRADFMNKNYNRKIKLSE